MLILKMLLWFSLKMFKNAISVGTDETTVTAGKKVVVMLQILHLSCFTGS